METRNGIACYDGPPVFILSPEATKIVRRLPEDSENITAVYMDMADGKRIEAVVFGGGLVDLPEPYVPRDIRVIGKLY